MPGAVEPKEASSKQWSGSLFPQLCNIPHSKALRRFHLKVVGQGSHFSNSTKKPKRASCLRSLNLIEGLCSVVFFSGFFPLNYYRVDFNCPVDHLPNARVFTCILTQGFYSAGVTFLPTSKLFFWSYCYTKEKWNKFLSSQRTKSYLFCHMYSSLVSKITLVIPINYTQN